MALSRATLTRALVTLALTLLTHAATADVFTIRLFRYGLPSPADMFNDGMPPPFGPNGAVDYYAVTGPAGLGPEEMAPTGTIGGLSLNPSLGQPSISPGGRPTLITNAVRRSLEDPDAPQTLSIGKDFSTVGFFDTTVPSQELWNYGIRLQNFTGFGVGGSEVLYLTMILAAGGIPEIQLFEQDFVAHTFSVLASYTPNASDLAKPYIGLGLHHMQGEEQVSAQYCFFDNLTTGCPNNPTVLGFGTFFQDTDWTRSAFLAVAVIPEPATLALLSIALAGLGFSRRRKLP